MARTPLLTEILMSLRHPLLLILIGIAAASGSDAADSPFVAGFERFHRHTDSPDGGRLLLAELNCTACHATDSALLKPSQGPQLDGAGLRLQSEWLKRFLTSPSSTKPGTAMPDVLGQLPDSKRKQAVSALIAFLSIQRADFAKMESTGGNPIAQEFWRKGDAERGQKLYHQIGCIACHEPDADYAAVPKQESPYQKMLAQLDPEELQELGLADSMRPVPSIPHAKLPEKYTRLSLTHFLLNPATVRPHGRMPNFNLTVEQAADLTAYLFHQQPAVDSLPESTDADLVDQGRRLFAELRCNSCHSATGADKPIAARPLADLSFDASAGCIGKPTAGRPRFQIDDAQRQAIGTAVADQPANPPTTSAAETELQFRMTQLNCFACHSRNQQGGIGPQRRDYLETHSHVDLGDEGRIPPPLDTVGRKLRTGWMTKVLDGKGAVRPHMTARMPVFANSLTEPLPGLFAAVDDAQTQSAEQVFVGLKDKDVAQSGRLLLDTGCVQCHPLRGEQLSGVVGVDLQNIEERVHPQWFHDFLLNPVALKQRTRMPTFFPKGQSSSRDILDGDTEQQIAAIWSYLVDIEKQTLPDKLLKGRIHNFELVPEDRPILLRTFMKDAGPHAVAVGFPQKLHFAFDSEVIRLAQLWKGRFLDAHGTWFDRFTPLAEPLGQDVVSLPAAPEFAVQPPAEGISWQDSTAHSSTYRFGGYRLDESGIPTFLYQVGSVRVEDRLTPDGPNAFVRTLQLTAADGQAVQVWFRPLVGRRLEQVSQTSCRNEQQLLVQITGHVAGKDRIENTDKASEWIVPIRIEDRTAVQVRYEW
jgi:mono/diheme cytochrome c family protein